MKKSEPRAPRSRKAGRPPMEIPSSPQVRRRRKTAHGAVSKGTELSQAAQGPRVRWAAGKPKEKKR